MIDGATEGPGSQVKDRRQRCSDNGRQRKAQVSRNAWSASLNGSHVTLKFLQQASSSQLSTALMPSCQGLSCTGCLVVGQRTITHICWFAHEHPRCLRRCCVDLGVAALLAFWRRRQSMWLQRLVMSASARSFWGSVYLLG